MARVNIDILGIRELKWTGMGEFNSDDHHIYYCGHKSLGRNRVAIIINKGLEKLSFGQRSIGDKETSTGTIQGKWERQEQKR